MGAFTVHLVILFRSKKKPVEYESSYHTLSGEQPSEEIKKAIAAAVKRMKSKWEIVGFSHSFPNFVAENTEEQTIHVLVLYRNRKNRDKYLVTTHTLSGDDLFRRANTIFIETRSWDADWEFVGFSHALLPFEATYQL